MTLSYAADTSDVQFAARVRQWSTDVDQSALVRGPNRAPHADPGALATDAPPAGAAAALLAKATVTRIGEALRDRRSRAVDVVYDDVDALLLASRLEDAHVVLVAIAQNEMPLAILLSALVVSYPWRALLGNAREQLAKKARQLAFADGGESKVREISRFL